MPVTPPDFPYLTAVNAYGLYCIPQSFRTREVSKLLLKGKVNEPRTLSLIRQFVGEGDVISGGAFVGDFLPFLSRSVTAGAQVYSFEPNPTGFAATAMTLQLNDLENVTVSPVAVGREAATMPLQIASPSGREMGGTSRIVAQAEEGLTVDVEIVRIDDLVPADRRVSVLHLDIEGYEWPAVQGAARTIAKSQPLIVLETLPAEDPLNIEGKLRELCPEAGYTFIGMMERNAFYKPFNT